MHVLVCVLRNVDLSRYARGLSPAGQIHGVTEQTVPGHPVTDHPGHHLAAVYANRYALRKFVKKNQTNNITSRQISASQRNICLDEPSKVTVKSGDNLGVCNLQPK